MRHDLTLDNRLAKVTREVTCRVEVPIEALMTGTLSRTARVSEVTRNLKEAAGKPPVRGIRTVYEASSRLGERAKRLEAQCHPEPVGVNAADMWRESHASYPERSVVVPRASRAETFGDGTAEVSRGHSSCGQTAAKGRTIRTLWREPFVI